MLPLSGAIAREGHMTIARRKLLAVLGGAAAWPIAARAQQRKVPRVGVLVAEASGLEQFWRL